MASRLVLAAAWVLMTGIPASGGERVIASVPAGDCFLNLEMAESWPALRLRACHPNHRPCLIEKTAVIRTLTQAFSEPHPIWISREFTSLAMGRLIDYPWLVQLLAFRAVQDPQWNAAAGKARGVHVNRYVADVLSSREILDAIEAPMRGGGYRVIGVSVEKVLIGGFDNVPQLDGPRPKGIIPFDAQVWFRLEHD
jgi:hypothetical protein